MCELLAITSKKPTTVGMSLDQFASHGSDASANSDGWGIDDIRGKIDTIDGVVPESGDVPWWKRLWQ
jgi:predicted glutamine amidotransferase